MVVVGDATVVVASGTTLPAVEERASVGATLVSAGVVVPVDGVRNGAVVGGTVEGGTVVGGTVVFAAVVGATVVVVGSVVG